jgi:hypothetical protein
VVHRGGVISGEFIHRHGALFNTLRQPYKKVLGQLKSPGTLQLPDVIFYAMIATHHRAARWLNMRLQTASGRTRGVIHLPGSGLDEPQVFDPELKPKALLIKHDHSESLRWIHDADFREQVMRAFPKAAAKYLKNV